MAQRSMFWDSENGDRLYTAEDFAGVFEKVLTDGWLVGWADDFAITDPGAGLTLNVGTGAMWLQGKVYENTAALPMVFAQGDPVNPRIDRIVVRADYALRTITMLVKQGVPGAVPVAPALTRVDGVTWELSIAQVAVAANALDVVVGDVTMELEDPALAGGVEIMGFPPTIASLLGVDVGGIATGDTLVWDGDEFVPSLLQNPATDMVVDLLQTDAQFAAAIWELEAKAIASDNGFTNWHGEAFVPGMNRVASRTLDANGFPRLGIYRDPDRDQGFIGLDDYVPLESYKGLMSNGSAAAFVAGGAFIFSPDKKWCIANNGTTSIRVYPVVDGVVQMTAITPLPAVLSANATPGALAISPDGKTVFVGLQTTPFIEARPFDTATGVLGAKWADPATLPTAAVQTVAVTPNNLFIVLGVNAAAAADSVKAWAVNTVAGTWGGVTAPATPFAAAGCLGAVLTEAGDYVIANQSSAMAAWTFNQATGAFGGARIDAAVPANNLNQSAIRYANGKIVGLSSAAPYVHAWTFAAGVFSAKWAAPATAPGGSLARASSEISADGRGFLFFDAAAASQGMYAYPLNAAAFGAKFIPAGVPAMTSGIQGVTRLPWENRGDVAAFNSSFFGGIGLFGDKAGTDQLTGQMETTTKVLAANISQVYIAEDFVRNNVNVTHQYDVSTDGGANWTLNVPVGAIVNVPAGDDLRIRLTMTRTGAGQNGFINWFNVWGG